MGIMSTVIIMTEVYSGTSVTRKNTKTQQKEQKPQKKKKKHLPIGSRRCGILASYITNTQSADLIASCPMIVRSYFSPTCLGLLYKYLEIISLASTLEWQETGGDFQPWFSLSSEFVGSPKFSALC